MRFPEVCEAVTFPNLDEVLVRRCAYHGVFPLPGHHTESGVKVEVRVRTEQQATEAIAALTEHHRKALTDEAVRFYQQLDEPTEGLESYSTAAAGTLIWDARLLPIRFTGHRTCCGDLVRAHTVAESGVWEPVAERSTVLADYASTARVLWQLVCELSD